MIQDSYSLSHTQRENNTGKIIGFQSYLAQDADKHKKEDEIAKLFKNNENYDHLVKYLPGVSKAMEYSNKMLQAILDFDCTIKGKQDFTKFNQIVDEVWQTVENPKPNDEDMNFSVDKYKK